MITARPKPLLCCVGMEVFIKSVAFGRHFGVFVLVMMMLTSISNAGGQAVQDSRCYLMNGGAVESFFVSEDIPIGSIIGTLNVHGDPDEINGNIILSLTEKDSPVTISSGSKNITLIKGLDKEAVTGPSSVYVNVRCDRKGTTDPSFVIPVSIRVTDANDNAPVWSSAPYSVRLSELTAVGTRVLAARATDADQHGPHATVNYRVVPGTHSEYFEFVNELEGALMLKKPLDYETLSNLSVALRAQDQGQPSLYSDTLLQVEVLDADDQNPKFLDDRYTAQLPDNIVKGMELSVSPGAISAVDQDVGINAPLYYSITGDYKENFLVEKDSGQLFVANVTDDLDMPVTLVIRATQYDNADRYALATLTISRSRRAAMRQPVRFAQPSHSAAVVENLPTGSVVLTLVTNQPRSPKEKGLQYYVSDRSFLNNFMINSAGEVVLRKALDYEQQQHFNYQVMVTDGTYNDTTAVNISVLNVNEWEPRFRYPQYEFFVSPQPTDESGRMFVGQLEVADGDEGDYVSLSLRGPDSYLFDVDEAGTMTMLDASISLLNSSLVHLVAVAVDSGTPPRQSSVPIIVHMSESLMSSTGVAASGGVLIIIVFASIMSVLAVVILALVAYIYSVKRPKSSGRSNKVATGYVQHEKSQSSEQSGGSSTLGGGGLTGGTGGLAAAGASSGSLLSISAGASTILANSNSSLNLNGTLNGQEGVTRTSQRALPPRHKATPAPAPPLPPPTHMSDHIHEGGAGSAGGRSGVAWPSATIPARVKKLSWDDDDQKTQNQSSPSAEIHDATNPNVAEHMNLTVYF